MSGESPSGSFRVELLAAAHDRKGFTCGVESLDGYLKTQAGQDVRRKANAVFVLVEESDPSRIVGFFSLCATSLLQGDVPEEARKHVPRYPLVSATLIGRLAVSTARQRQGIGQILLVSALRKAYLSAGSVGSSMVVVDALDEAAVRFYSAHGFVKLPDSMRLVLAMRVIEKLVESYP